METIILLIIAAGCWITLAPLAGISAKNKIIELRKNISLLQQRIQKLEDKQSKNFYDEDRRALLKQIANEKVTKNIPLSLPKKEVEIALPSEIIQEILETEEILKVAPSQIQTPLIKQSVPKTIQPKQPSKIQEWIKKGFQWFGEGNVPVKVGMLILLFGVGGLLKYALEQSWFTMGHALLLTGASAIGAFIFAYVKKNSHRIFSLTLQGGSIGVLLLTLFAASKIELLISLNVALLGSIILIVATAILSIRQNAIALAIFAIFSGFMAPIWLSSGSNNYIALFSYYTLLNLGIITIAWFKPWQKLNLLGFLFTFAVGISWGILKYTPENFSTTEPFLILFFVLYLIIPVLYANRMKDKKEKMVDAFLVFGNPLITLSIQSYLLDYSKPLLVLNACIFIGIDLWWIGLFYP